MIENPTDKQYQELISHVLKYGERSEDRTGTGTISLVSSKDLVFDMRQYFPILSTKRIPMRLVFEELKWFLSGSTNSKVLEDNKVNIWASWGNPITREHGPIYGKQWRDWSVIVGPFGSTWVQSQFDADTLRKLSRKPFGHSVWINPYTYLTVESIDDDQLLVKHVDQIKYVLYMIEHKPDSRRILLNSWRVDQLDEMSLTPCHNQMQFKVYGDYLDLKLYQRSADLGLGVPFNISSYALLLKMVAKHVNKRPRYFIHSFGDLHIYENHIPQLKEQMQRTHYMSTRLAILCQELRNDLSEYVYQDIELFNYVSWPNTFEAGPMQVAV